MKKLVFLIAVSVLLTLINGCQKDNDFFEETVSYENAENMNFSEGQMILGDKLENPYSVENMQKAYNILQNENKLKSSINIKATHFYVRFRPRNFKELDIITRDTTLDFYDYPLDFEIKKGGTHYHDPEIPVNEITWQYTVVPIDYDFPKVNHQKLAKLFLPEESNELTELKSGKINLFDWKKLETKALQITDNLYENSGTRLKSVSYIPSGKIKVWDDYLTATTQVVVFDHWEYFDCTGEIDPTQDNPDTLCRRPVYRYETLPTGNHYIPVEGVEVRANRWFTTHKGYTDASGSFVCDRTFDRDANYSIKWERWDFDIRDGSYGQAFFNGPKQSGPWYLNIEQSLTPKSYLFAHIFRAAHTYYYKKSQWGIKAPPRRDRVFGALGHQLHIAGKDKDGQSHYFDWNEFLISAQVVVYSKPSGSSSYHNSRTLFGTTIHELAHASHWEIGYNGGVWLLDNTLGESWATGVEAVITNDIYSTNDYETKQNETIADMSDGYTSIVWDMIDEFNQRDIWGSAYPDDDVSGYSISQLEYALLFSPTNWWGWRNEIKNKFSNTTETHLDKLFQDLH